VITRNGKQAPQEKQTTPKETQTPQEKQTPMIMMCEGKKTKLPN